MCVSESWVYIESYSQTKSIFLPLNISLWVSFVLQITCRHVILSCSSSTWYEVWVHTINLGQGSSLLYFDLCYPKNDFPMFPTYCFRFVFFLVHLPFSLLCLPQLLSVPLLSQLLSSPCLPLFLLHVHVCTHDVMYSTSVKLSNPHWMNWSCVLIHFTLPCTSIYMYRWLGRLSIYMHSYNVHVQCTCI